MSLVGGFKKGYSDWGDIINSQKKGRIENQYLPDKLQAENELLGNQAGIAGNTLKYAPQMSQAELNKILITNQYLPDSLRTDNAYKKALAARMMERSGLAGGATESTVGKMIADRQLLAQKYGENSPQVRAMDAAIDKAGRSGGMTVYDANGNPIFQSGDATVKDPRFGSSRSGAGGTYIDPITGKKISTDTNSMTSTDQNSLAGAQRVTPIINEIIQTLPQFQTAKQRGIEKVEGVSNALLGTDYQKPSELALGEADISMAAEGLIKAYGLRVSDQALNMMKDAIKPKFGESPNGYKNRLVNTLNKISEFEGQSKERLSEGSEVTAPLNSQPAGSQPVSNQMVPVVSPNGQRGMIPAANLDNALKAGYKKG
jgi:hypothetical protein